MLVGIRTWTMFVNVEPKQAVGIVDIRQHDKLRSLRMTETSI